jgi:Tol biopolymer transport system component
LLLALLLVFAPGAYASFPGRNGRIAVLSPDRDGIWDIAPEGKRLHRLTAKASRSAPAYAPSGRALAFSESSSGGALWEVSADGLTTRPLVPGAEFAEPPLDPAYSPSGRALAVDGFPRSGVSVIRRSTGSVVRRLTGHEDVDPAWSTSGIAFTRVLRGRDECDPDVPELTDLFLIQPDRTGLRRVTRTFGASTPDWSPDGRTLAFTRDENLSRADLRPRPRIHSADDPCARGSTRGSQRNGMASASPAIQIWAVRADGSALRRLGDGSDPVWSPDGRQIAFDDGGDVWVMKADGTGRRRLVANRLYPAWQPLPRR